MPRFLRQPYGPMRPSGSVKALLERCGISHHAIEQAVLDVMAN
jgi:hypothetical protein